MPTHTYTCLPRTVARHSRRYRGCSAPARPRVRIQKHTRTSTCFCLCQCMCRRSGTDSTRNRLHRRRSTVQSIHGDTGCRTSNHRTHPRRSRARTGRSRSRRYQLNTFHRPIQEQTNSHTRSSPQFRNSRCKGRRSDKGWMCNRSRLWCSSDRPTH